MVKDLFSRSPRPVASSLMVGLLTTCSVAAFSPSASARQTPKASTTPAQVVVRIDRADGYTIRDVEAEFPVKVTSVLLGTRGIYLVESTDARYTSDPGSTHDLADHIAHSDGVIYAEPNYATTLDDSQFHAWPDGSPSSDHGRYQSWKSQPAAEALDLDDVHATARGAGIKVAVLDTGADAGVPALAGHVATGWNYVEDNDNTDDVADFASSSRNGALGHGTFVSGIVRLVAPKATIVPERVLNSDGQGNTFVVAQAILDATNNGVDVINLSLGTATPIPSHLLNDALNFAQRHGVVVVAAAGNDGDNKPHFPAASPSVVGVGALSADMSKLASYSDYGGWVALAAPGTKISGPMPGDSYAWWQGTSIASPFVAGEAAVVSAKYPALKPNDVIGVMERSAHKMDKVEVGNGRIDILAALNAAAHKAGPTPPR